MKKAKNSQGYQITTTEKEALKNLRIYYKIETNKKTPPMRR